MRRSDAPMVGLDNPAGVVDEGDCDSDGRLTDVRCGEELSDGLGGFALASGEEPTGRTGAGRRGNVARNPNGSKSFSGAGDVIFMIAT